jgi:DNA repair exonuclease SbcCD ATPase subunit
MKKSTYTLAYEACEKLFSESGQLPTIETIKHIININSPNTISSAIKDWKKALPQSVKTSFNTSEMPAFLFETISTIWQQALIQASNIYNVQLKEIQEKQARLASKEAELFDEKIRIEHLSQFNEQKHLDQIANLNLEIIRLTAESAKIIEQIEHYRSLATDYVKNNDLLLKQLNQERDKFKRLEHQYNKEHDWALNRIAEEKSISQQNTQNEIERLKSESSRNRQHKEHIQAKLETATRQINEYKARIQELERSLSDETESHDRNK